MALRHLPARLHTAGLRLPLIYICCTVRLPGYVTCTFTVVVRLLDLFPVVDCCAGAVGTFISVGCWLTCGTLLFLALYAGWLIPVTLILVTDAVGYSCYIALRGYTLNCPRGDAYLRFRPHTLRCPAPFPDRVRCAVDPTVQPVTLLVVGGYGGQPPQRFTLLRLLVTLRLVDSLY